MHCWPTDEVFGSTFVKSVPERSVILARYVGRATDCRTAGKGSRRDHEGPGTPQRRAVRRLPRQTCQREDLPCCHARTWLVRELLLVSRLRGQYSGNL